jgi:hypothetical protein
MSAAAVPIVFEFDGEVMRPQQRYAWQARRLFAVGAAYPLVIHEERSDATHRHYFAAINEAWKNLPEALSKKHPSAEHLRRWALVKAGYADERSIVCDSNAEALKVAAFIKPMDDYAVVIVRDEVVRVFTAKSQSARAMDKKSFQESKTAVLEIVAELIGVDVQTLSSNSNSSGAPQGQTDTPATRDAPTAQVAGTPSELSAAPPGPDNVAARGDESGGSVAPQPTLPQGWEIRLREALGRAQRPASLLDHARQCFEKLGAFPSSPGDVETAKAIRAAFENNFGEANKETRENLLRELV